MRFLHLGDLHIGKSLGDFNLCEDQKYILNQIVDMAVAQTADAVLLAGDIYDKAIPSEEAVRTFDAFIRRLVAEKIRVFAISGNHDSDERLNFGSSLFEANDVYIAAKYTKDLYVKTMQDDYGDVNFYMLPFVKASQVRAAYPEAKIENYEDAVREILSHIQVDTSKRNILLAHQFVIGRGSDPEISGSEGMSVKSVGLVEKIGYDCFDAFDYVALGHIHSPQQIGRETVRYSGSLLKYSLSEVHSDKSVPMITVREKGDVQIELLPLHPMRDLRHIRGRFEQLLAKDSITDPQDFIYATLTDEDYVMDAMLIMQQYYPNTVRIDYDNSHSQELSSLDVAAFTEQKGFRELISEFYFQMYDSEISQEELTMMKEIAREAGVHYEAD